MSDIFEEVKEELKEKRLNKAIGISTITLLCGGIILIAYLGISSWYQSHTNEKIQEDGVFLTKISQEINTLRTKNSDGKLEQKIGALEKFADTDTSTYTALGNFYLASMSLQNNNSSKAIYYYQRVAKDPSYGKTLNQYSELIELQAKLQYGKISNEDAAKKCKEYLDMDDTKNIDKKFIENLIFPQAFALTGIATNIANNNLEEAKKYTAVLDLNKNDENVEFISGMLKEYLKGG